MNRKRRLHDGIVATVVAAGTALGYWVDAPRLLVPGVIGLLTVQGGFTGFCPVCTVLDGPGLSDGPSVAPERT